MKRFTLVLVVMALLAIFVIPTLAQDEAVEGNQIDIETHPLAAFLESDLYAVAKVDATNEFRKMEWIAIDEDNNLLYMVISEAARGMSDDEGDIKLTENPCGIVYVGEMDANMMVSSMRPAIYGGPFDETNADNPCSVDSIAEPDSVFVDRMGRVWIGEDTGRHQNNMVWVLDPATATLTRFAYVPLGAEVTGIFVTDEGAVFMNYQHPETSNSYPYNASVAGVFAGFNAYEDKIAAVPVPEGEAQTVVGSSAGEYQILARVGDPVLGDPRGLSAGAVVRADGSTQLYCNNFDGNMFLPTNEAGTAGYLYSNLECQPGGMNRLSISMNEDRSWTVLDGEVVDFLGVNGTWNNCGASVSPWNTGLSGEEYPPFAGDFATISHISDYLGHPANPYDYGWLVEISPDAVGNSIQKHYAMGRFAWEMGAVAPDLRTVYSGNDGTDMVMFRFVAAEPGDLSCGTLYAAKITQVGGPGADHELQIDWRELGSACDADVEAAIRELDPAQ